jgi:hypothetical protein
LLGLGAGPWIGAPNAVYLACCRGHEKVIEALLGSEASADERTDAKVAEAFAGCIRMGHAGIARAMARSLPAVWGEHAALLGMAASEGRAASLALLLEHETPEAALPALLEQASHPSIANAVLQVLPADRVRSVVESALRAGQYDVVTELVRALGDSSMISRALQAMHVDLRNQWRDTLPLWMADARSLAVCQGNTLAALPHVACDSDAEVLQYLRKTSSHSEALPSFCVMVLGAKGAGKTHLLQYVSGRKYSGTEKTAALDIHQVVLENRSVMWYDYGGDAAFEPTNQSYFLAGARDAVHVVVFNAQDANWDQVGHVCVCVCERVREFVRICV